MKKIDSGFAAEQWRKELLAARSLTELLKTYTDKYPVIPGSNTPEFWDKKFTGDNTTLFPMAYARNSMIAHSLRPNSRVLNLGAGKGYLEKFVQNIFGTSIIWTGTDFTRKSIDDLKKCFSAFSFIRTGLLKLPFTKQQFDTVCLLEVIEHIVPAETFIVLREAVRVLKQNGTLIVSVPLNEGLEKMMPHNPNAHMRVYSIELLRFELESVGLQVERIETLSAFGTFFSCKHFINKLFQLRQPNNVIMWARKVL